MKFLIGFKDHKRWLMVEIYDSKAVIEVVTIVGLNDFICLNESIYAWRWKGQSYMYEFYKYLFIPLSGTCFCDNFYLCTLY